MKDVEYTKVLKGRRVSIPISLCNKYNLRVGDLIAVEDSGNDIRVYPIEIQKKKLSQNITSHEIKRHVCAEDCKGKLNLAAFEGMENDPDYSNNRVLDNGTMLDDGSSG